MKYFILLLLLIIKVHSNAQKPFSSYSAIEKIEFIYDEEDVWYPSCHASTIDEINGGLIAAWFGGTAEKNDDVGIWISRFMKGKWTKPVEVANGIQHKTLRYPCWNPVLFNTGKKLLLFYKVGPNPKDWWGEIITSKDKGKSWSQARRLPEEIWGPIKNKPELLGDGTLLCPSSTEHEGWQVHMEMTKDQGLTWERTNAINDGKEFGAIQPTLLIHKNKIQALSRSTNGRILSTWSDDNGKTWSKMESLSLPNPNSGIDAVTLFDGRHVLVYNHVESSKTWGDRHILNLAVSEDGISWEACVLLENDSDSNAEYSYPAVIQTNDGMIHITYTWNRKLIKHLVLNPAKLKTKKIIDGKWPE